MMSDIPATSTAPKCLAPLTPAEAPPIPLWTALLILGAATGGAALAVGLLPLLFPGLAASMLGPDAKAYWYLSRSSAFVAFLLLWLSMVFGLLMTSRFSRLWPGAPATYDLHQFTSLLGLAFALFHALIQLGDRYIGYSLIDLAVPFAGRAYRPLSVGAGQVTFYVSLVVAMSFYVRHQIGRRTWRLLHFASFASFALALTHGALAGSDSGQVWTRAMYWAAGASVLFLTYYRLVRAIVERARPATRPASRAPLAPLAPLT